MDERAHRTLDKLLAAANRADAGVTTRAPALTASHLAEYHASPSLQSKEAFEVTMQDARAQGAVELVWDDFTQTGFIKRVNLGDIRKLASFLGQETAANQVAEARIQLEDQLDRFPVLREVLQRWQRLKTARGLGPQEAPQWLDAIRVVEFARTNTEAIRVDVPLRVASARLFNDSKRIERLAVPLDVLLVGDLEALPRDPSDVWRELGLFREEQPVRLAGRVIVKRERVTDYLDTPYSGLASTTIRGLGSTPSAVLSIENQTNFHVEARSGCDKDVLLLYSAGMPSPAWRAMYATVLRDVPAGTPVYHWGDLDEGGFRIAARIAKDAAMAGHSLKPWRMHPDDVPQERRCVATEGTLRAHSARPSPPRASPSSRRRWCSSSPTSTGTVGRRLIRSPPETRLARHAPAKGAGCQASASGHAAPPAGPRTTPSCTANRALVSSRTWCRS
jgi:Uncharacterized protein conserved in bacteria C-term(DUF2220)